MAFDILVNENLKDVFQPGSGWAKGGDHNIVVFTNLADYIFTNATQLIFAGSALFIWTDGGPSPRAAWIEKTYTGLPPNILVGVRVNSTWLLRLNLFMFMRLIGGDVPTHVLLTDTAFNFWTVQPGFAGLKVREQIAFQRTTALGELTVRLGMEQAHSTNNMHAVFEELQIVQFRPNQIHAHIIKPQDL